MYKQTYGIHITLYKLLIAQGVDTHRDFPDKAILRNQKSADLWWAFTWCKNATLVVALILNQVCKYSDVNTGLTNAYYFGEIGRPICSTTNNINKTHLGPGLSISLLSEPSIIYKLYWN